MKLLFRYVTTISGYGSIEPVHRTILGCIFQKKHETCCSREFIRSLVDK